MINRNDYLRRYTTLYSASANNIQEITMRVQTKRYSIYNFFFNYIENEINYLDRLKSAFNRAISKL